MVYANISIDGCADLHIIRNVILADGRYRDEILWLIVACYAAAIEDDFIFIDDNWRPHRANLVDDILLEKWITRMEWPACPSDMNPTEHVSDILLS